MTQTALSYKGTLTLETKTRSAIARNDGTVHLFRLLSTFLCREIDGTRSLPSYLMLYKGAKNEILNNPDTSANISKQQLRKYVDIVSQSTATDTTYESTFTSTIDYSMLASVIPENEREDNNIILALVSGDKKDILAVVEFDKDVYGIVANYGQTYVKWTMTIANAEKQEAEEA